MIGIIISPGYGAGWSTWLGESELALDQELAKAIDKGKPYEEIKRIAKRNHPYAYLGGLRGCYVDWVEEGTPFRIDEYDGYESLILTNDFIPAIAWEAE